MPDFNYELTGDQIPKNGDLAYQETDTVLCEDATARQITLTYKEWLRQRTTITIVSILNPQVPTYNSVGTLPEFVPDQPIS